MNVKKGYVILGIVALMFVTVFYIIYISNYSKTKNNNGIFVENYKNATYNIDGQLVTLNNGKSETTLSPNSTTKTITQYFGNEVKHDLDDDGREDVAFLITQETGGSGVFFYVVAALNTPSGYVGSQAFFLGDRIAPQTTEINEGLTPIGTNRQNVIVVNYATRLPNEPFTAKPWVGKSMWIKLDPKTMQFGEVMQNFEGEKR